MSLGFLYKQKPVAGRKRVGISQGDNTAGMGCGFLYDAADVVERKDFGIKHYRSSIRDEREKIFKSRFHAALIFICGKGNFWQSSMNVIF